MSNVHAGSGDHEGLDREDSAPGDSRVAKSVIAYVIGLGLAVMLTVASFVLSGTDWLYGPSLPVALIVLAIAQIGIHLVYFLHITTAPDNTNNVMALVFGVFIVFLVIGGSIWIMGHLNGNMMPAHQLGQIGGM
ncbi:MAG: cytochrome o ubiquinol oxidase subunit IV [Acetobacteraceae bacterium]|nr:cytochrome o ubiquinol oxidase subunit IV [Acetobacteraceae bacterium]